jgi:hypothetical protein
MATAHLRYDRIGEIPGIEKRFSERRHPDRYCLDADKPTAYCEHSGETSGRNLTAGMGAGLRIPCEECNMASWFVPPIVVPLMLAALILGSALHRAVL